MSQLGEDFNQVPQIDTAISGAKLDQAQPVRTNGALQLAASLQDLNPKIAQAALPVIREDEAVQTVAAKKRALELGGKSLADAVRSGEIAPTQNPFFIQHYNQESAYVRATSDLSNLALDSQQWAEKNNPAAFQQKYSQELAKIGQNYSTDPDTQAGFASAAAPAQQQAFAANTAQVAASIEKDRDNNLSQIITQGVVATQTDHAGAASPQQLLDDLAPTKQRYMDTGGTTAGWNKLLYNGYTSAGYNSGDPSILDKLPQEIKDLPGIADQIATDKYHIEQDHSSALRMQAQDLRDKITLEGQQMVTGAMQKYGTDALTGKVDYNTLLKDNPGANPLSISSALNTIQATTADNQALAVARTRAMEQTGSGASYILGLHTEAATVGMSQDLNSKVGELVASNEMSAQDGQQILDKAIETTKARAGGGFMGNNPARAADAATAATYGSAKPFADLRKATDAEAVTMTQWVNKSARVAGNPGVPPTEVKRLQTLMAGAATQWLNAHPGDFAGARRAAQSANGLWFQENADTYTKSKTK